MAARRERRAAYALPVFPAAVLRRAESAAQSERRAELRDESQEAPGRAAAVAQALRVRGRATVAVDAMRRVAMVAFERRSDLNSMTARGRGVSARACPGKGAGRVFNRLKRPAARAYTTGDRKADGERRRIAGTTSHARNLGAVFLLWR